MPINRRELLLAGSGLAGGLLLSGKFREAMGQTSRPADPIDRKALVRRHNPQVEQIDPFSALSVGNGDFAFTVDATGLQTFPDSCREQFPLCTTAHWAWHTTPAPPGLDPLHFRYRMYDVQGRRVGYATDKKDQEPLFDWLRENPHRFHLGRIGLTLTRADGSIAGPSDISLIHQTLDLWTGIIRSAFQFDGEKVVVQTACHPQQDAVVARIESSLVHQERIGVKIAFPYPSPDVEMADWNSPGKHQTHCGMKDRSAAFSRSMDRDSYQVLLSWNSGKLGQTGPHEFQLLGGAEVLEFTAHFSPQPISDEPADVEQSLGASANHWEKFWTTGGAVDLSQSADPRAMELERRIVLSQYNTALHCAGPMPPPETGLLFNSWYGKSHLEMHWWHGVHFACWGRFSLLEKSLDFYHRILPVARAIAARQGYAGARWPKMVDADGNDSPSPVGPLLIWQQPHPIYYAELCYRQNPARQVLDQWSAIVFATADFMASYAQLVDGRYVLGPPLKTVSENTDTLTTRNPTFELAYWGFGLGVARQWCERLGLPVDPKWVDVQNRLSPFPTQDGTYLMQEGMTDTFTKWNWEHPAVLGALGMQIGSGIDPEVMRRTLKKVMAVWQWDRCWGWDFPMAAMTAARLGEGELAVQALLIDSVKNRYLPNGHVYQRANLTAYLPANGGLLAAIAMMVLCPGGFPRDGKWVVRSEGITRLL